MAWDSSFKNILKTFLHDNEVVTEFEVPQANLRFDFLIRRKEKILSPFHLAKENIIGEFKSERDRFNINEFHRAMAKAYLFSSNEEISLSEISLFFILGGRGIPRDVRDMYEINQIESGILQVVHTFEVIIVLLDQIEYDESNYFLGLFAGRKYRAEIIKKSLQEQQKFIISIAYFLYKDEVVAVAEAEKINLDPTSMSIKSAVESIGLSRVIGEVGLSRVIEEVGLSRVIEEFGIEKLFESMSKEDIKKLRELMGE